MVSGLCPLRGMLWWYPGCVAGGDVLVVLAPCPLWGMLQDHPHCALPGGMLQQYRGVQGLSLPLCCSPWGALRPVHPLACLGPVLPCWQMSPRPSESSQGARLGSELLLPEWWQINDRALVLHRNLLETCLCLKMHANFWASHPLWHFSNPA